MANSVQVTDLTSTDTIEGTDVLLIARNDGKSYQIPFSVLYNKIYNDIKSNLFDQIQNIMPYNSIAAISSYNGQTDNTKIDCIGPNAGKEFITWMQRLENNLTAANWS